jgi:hypothetical protein
MSYVLHVIHIQCFKRMEPAWFVHVILSAEGMTGNEKKSISCVFTGTQSPRYIPFEKFYYIHSIQFKSPQLTLSSSSISYSIDCISEYSG